MNQQALTELRELEDLLDDALQELPEHEAAALRAWHHRYRRSQLRLIPGGAS